MKKIKRVFAVLLSCVALTLSFAGCADNSARSSATEIQICFWKSGYGIEWIDEIIKGFNESQSEYHATREPSTNASSIIQTLDLGADNYVDLYFTMLNTNLYNSDFTKLDDVLDSKATGENVTIRSKYDEAILDGVKEEDGTTRFLTYGNGWGGLVYNADVIDGVKYTVPRTTKELEKLVAQLASEGKTPFKLWSNPETNGYWNYIVSAWEAQYDGLDYYYNNMFMLKDEKGNSPSKEVFTAKDGRFKALETAEKLLTQEYVHRSIVSTVTLAQSAFVAGDAVMMVTGSWLLNETSGSNGNFFIMKTPVISSIVEKLENTKMSDSTLAKIIDEVDAGKTSSELCSDADFNRIKEARNVMYNNAPEHFVFIPDYSPAKEGAKEFLRYFYSDKGTLEFYKATKLPTSVRLADSSLYDISALPAWNRQQFDYADTLTALTNVMVKSPVFINHSLNQFANLSFSAEMCRDSETKKNHAELWNSMCALIEEKWNDWTKNLK